MGENTSISSKLNILFSKIGQGEITLRQFADDYIALWKELRDRTDKIIKSQPNMSEPLELLRKQYASGELTGISYADKMREILLQVEGCEVPPLSEIVSILDHLMVEADAFCEGSDLKIHAIGAEEFLKVIGETYLNLKDLSFLSE